MARSSIEWTEATWNPVTGCTKTSPGCKNCYALRMSHRLHAMGAISYRNGFDLTLHPRLLTRPLRWKSPQRIFVNSMSDLFHDAVPVPFVASVFEVMNAADWHQFQVLTKRSERLLAMDWRLPWAKNIWMGVSVESQKYTYRIDHLRQTGAAIKFLSLEPLLGPIKNIDLAGIDWVIVGGESGPGARPMDVSWIREIRDQCSSSKTPFFFKQWGGVFKKRAGRQLDGETWDEYPLRYESSRQYVTKSTELELTRN